MLILILILPYLVRGLLPLLPNYRPPRLPVATSDNGKKDSVSSEQETDSSPSFLLPTRLSLTTLPSSRDPNLSSTMGPSTSLPRQSSATEVSTVKSDKPTRQESRWKDHLKKGKGRKDRKGDSGKRKSDSDKGRKSSYYELPEDRYDSLTGMSIPMYPQRQPPSPSPSRPVSSYPSTSTTTSTSSTSTTASTASTTSTIMTTMVPSTSTTTKPLVALKMNRSLIAEVGHSV